MFISFQFRNDSTFVTGDNDGSVTLWKDKEITLTKKLFAERVLVIVQNGTIIAASFNRDIVEMDDEFDIKKTHRGTAYFQKPTALYANEKFLVVGYDHKSDDYGVRRPSQIIIKGRGQGLQASEVKFSPNQSRLKYLRHMKTVELFNKF